MIFTPERKAELLSFIDSLEPSVDPAPLLARIAELELEVAALEASVASLQTKITNAQAALA